MPEQPAARLRPWAWADEDALVRHAHNRNIWRNLRDVFPHPYTHEDARAWLERVVDARPITNFAIEVDGDAAGSIGLRLHEDIHRLSAEIGYWLGEAHWGQGIATDAVVSMTRYGFKEFGLERIHAEVFEYNPASMRVLEKAGYELEGRLRRAAVKDGRVIDLYLYAIVRDD